MKQKLTLLLLALVTSMGAWAKTALEYSVLTTGVDYVITDNTGNWAISNAAKTNGVFNAIKYRLVDTGDGKYYLMQSSTSQYIATAGDNESSVTWTSEQESAEKFTIDKRDNNTQVRFIASSGLFLNTASLGSGTCPRWYNGTGDMSYWYVYTYDDVYANFVASLPQLTSDPSSPFYYRIKSYNRGGYLTSNGADQDMTHVDFTNNAVWYFSAAAGNSSGNVTGGVIAHCYDGTQMTTGWKTAAEGGTIYILSNNVNGNGLVLCKNASITDWSCCDASNASTGVGDWAPNSGDWQGTTWVIEPTIPSGYYYFKGMATDRHPYLYSDYVGKGVNATYHHDLPGSPSNGHIWKVTNNGATFTVTNGEGLPVTIGSTTYETLTVGSAAVGPDFYFTEAINLTNWGNDTQLTTWAGYPNATDNHWTFEPVDVSAGIYNVIVEGNENGYVTYNGQHAKNGGFFVAATITEGDLTAFDIDNYSASVNVTDRTITITYTATFSYTLTDVNGETYSWSAVGTLGISPTLTGCAGYSLSNEVWDEGSRTYTADITFPFAVSSHGTENYTFIGQFNNKNGYSAPEFLWHVNGTSIIIHSGDLPTTEDSDHDKYLWSIIPAFSNGAFTFTIKNKSTGTYVNSTCTENRHNVGDVTLSETATPMTYNAANPTNTCSPINAWYLPSTSKYLSANSVFNGANAVLGVFGTVHDGISTGFPTYGDLISIYWSKNEIASKIAKAGQCGYPSATNEYILALNGVETALNGGSYPSTADSYNNLLTWYEGALSADVVKPEVGKFYKFKSANNRYIHAVTPGNIMQMNADGSSADAIFYIPYAGRFLSYTKGYAMSGRTIYNGYYNSGGYSTYTIDHYAGHGLGTIRIKGGTYLFDYDGSTDIYDSSNGTDANRYWTVEEVTSLPVTISAAGYATLYSPVALTIPSGVTAYVATDNTSYLSLTAIDGGIIPAETGVILAGDEGTYNFAIATGGSVDGNDLTGTTVAIARPENSYVLSKNNSDDVGFYKDGADIIPGFKAYFQGTGGGSTVKTFRFDEDATGLERVQGVQEVQGAIYNLAGQRLNKIQKGFNIVNGKKILK